MFLNTTDTYAMLQPFGSIEQLNANTSAIRAQYKTELTPAAREVLDVIHRYASKFYGVCYLAKAEIARMIGVSKRTVIRACQLLEALGCIAQYETKRVNGDKRQSTNAIVFLTQLAAKDAFVLECEQLADNMQEETAEGFHEKTVDKTDVTPHVTPNTLPNKAPEKELKDTYDTDARVANKKGLVSKLPKTLQHALAPFFDADELYTMSGIVFKAKASVDREIQIEQYEQDYYQAIVSVMNAYGRGKAKNVAGLLYSAVQAVSRTIWLKERTALFGF